VQSERPTIGQRPFVIAINRLAAARLLVSAGDTAEAIRLLHTHDADLPAGMQPLPVVDVIVGTLSFPMLARVESARGRSEQARRYNELFRERADLMRSDSSVLSASGVCGAAQ